MFRSATCCNQREASLFKSLPYHHHHLLLLLLLLLLLFVFGVIFSFFEARNSVVGRLAGGFSFTSPLPAPDDCHRCCGCSTRSKRVHLRLFFVSLEAAVVTDARSLAIERRHWSPADTSRPMGVRPQKKSALLFLFPQRERNRSITNDGAYPTASRGGGGGT